MNRLTPWNQHPRGCELLPNLDYDQRLEGDRVRASMAAILANVWIFNAQVRARKMAPMGVNYDLGTSSKSVAYFDGQPFLPKGIEVIKKTAHAKPEPIGICMLCNKMGQGFMVQFVDQIKKIETAPVFYCSACLASKVSR